MILWDILLVVVVNLDIKIVRQENNKWQIVSADYEREEVLEHIVSRSVELQ